MIFRYFPLTQEKRRIKYRHNTVEIKQTFFRIIKTVRSEIEFQVQWKAGYVLQRGQIIIPKSLQFWSLENKLHHVPKRWIQDKLSRAGTVAWKEALVFQKFKLF